MGYILLGPRILHGFGEPWGAPNHTSTAPFEYDGTALFELFTVLFALMFSCSKAFVFVSASRIACSTWKEEKSSLLNASTIPITFELPKRTWGTGRPSAPPYFNVGRVGVPPATDFTAPPKTRTRASPYRTQVASPRVTNPSTLKRPEEGMAL